MGVPSSAKKQYYKQMKEILHVAEDLSFESGGLRTVVANLDNYLQQTNNFLSTVLTNKKEPDDHYLEFPSDKFKFWNYSSNLTAYLNSQPKPNIIHVHGVFMHTQYRPSKLAQNNNIPYIVTPHGMLEPWHLKDKKLKKKIYFELLLKNILAKSKVLHAITPLEKESLFKLTRHKNICEIPNFIHHSSIPENLRSNQKEEYLLFLSRIHPKKGLDILIQAMSKIENKKIKLKIVGSENNYSMELKNICRQLNIDNRIEFVGGVYGNKKYELFANALAFVAPSYSEAIGVVNLEAAVCQTPVITTYNTGISPEWNNNGGIMINPNITELVKAINTITACNDAERNQRGSMMADFVIKNYSWEEKGHLWNDLYNSL